MLVGPMRKKRPADREPCSSPDELPPLSDPNHVAECYANHTAGLSFRDGVVHLTLSVVRPLHLTTVTGPHLENVVVARVALSEPAMQAIVQAFAQLCAAIQTPRPEKMN
ncbi:MAG: hypothetical protein EBS23_00740 [Betaproteobacteria bacterium]|nr:hypothetical protein [Betaproteobacteria bacterium]